MKGETLTYQNFTIYPEYCDHSIEELLEISKKDTQYHISAIAMNSKILTVVLYKGHMVYARTKHRLHVSETWAKAGSEKPGVTDLNRKKVLILICYEIMFPEDWIKIEDHPDLVIHMVGYPMFDENQREGWVALQKCLSLVYNCPVACCCGGERNQMNITGVING